MVGHGNEITAARQFAFAAVYRAIRSAAPAALCAGPSGARSPFKPAKHFGQMLVNSNNVGGNGNEPNRGAAARGAFALPETMDGLEVYFSVYLNNVHEDCSQSGWIAGSG